MFWQFNFKHWFSMVFPKKMHVLPAVFPLAPPISFLPPDTRVLLQPGGNDVFPLVWGAGRAQFRCSCPFISDIGPRCNSLLFQCSIGTNLIKFIHSIYIRDHQGKCWRMYFQDQPGIWDGSSHFAPSFQLFS